MKMIDIHNHLIPNVDDGPESIAITMEMLEIAQSDGIETIVATPHTFSSFSNFKTIEEVHGKFLHLKTEVRNSDLTIRVLPGAENYFDTRLRDYLPQYRQYITINDSDYFLLEFPSDFVFPGTRQFIYGVMSDGFIPIIAHPERNSEFIRNPSLLHEFMQMGALAQVTAGSFTGEFGIDTRTTAYKFLKSNMVSLIASDSHHSHFRTPGMSFIFEELKDFDRELLELLTHGVPHAVINNEAPPDTGTLMDPSKNSSVFEFMKKWF